jgi:hypothetical protein
MAQGSSTQTLPRAKRPALGAPKAQGALNGAIKTAEVASTFKLDNASNEERERASIINPLALLCNQLTA